MTSIISIKLRTDVPLIRCMWSTYRFEFLLDYILQGIRSYIWESDLISNQLFLLSFVSWRHSPNCADVCFVAFIVKRMTDDKPRQPSNFSRHEREGKMATSRSVSAWCLFGPKQFVWKAMDSFEKCSWTPSDTGDPTSKCAIDKNTKCAARFLYYAKNANQSIHQQQGDNPTPAAHSTSSAIAAAIEWTIARKELEDYPR